LQVDSREIGIARVEEERKRKRELSTNDWAIRIEEENREEIVGRNSFEIRGANRNGNRASDIVFYICLIFN